MSARVYTEDQLVERLAVGLFAALECQSLLPQEKDLSGDRIQGRETKGKVVLLGGLCLPTDQFDVESIR